MFWAFARARRSGSALIAFCSLVVHVGMAAAADDVNQGVAAINADRATQAAASSTQPTPDKLLFFENKVRPLLVERCYECHSVEADEAAGELRVDTAEALARGGSHGPAVVPGNGNASVLLRAVSYEDFDMQMPPDGKLDGEEIAILQTWIESGAIDPRQEATVEGTGADAGGPTKPSDHWAFRPPREATGLRLREAYLHAIENDLTSQDDVIDTLVLDAAAEEGLTVSKPLDRPALLRRLAFDLTGLPPSQAEIARFVADRRPDAVTRVVDRYLASPDYAERFGRHWLDVARYADTRGYATAGKERRLKGSERYRDWVLRAFATDMPYDEMIRHQLAGDQTDPNNDEGNADAMGFLTIGRRFLRHEDTLDDRIDVITRGLLGLTVQCARCHDHKFDPIPTVDYYGLYGMLENSVEPAVPEDGPQPASPLMLVDRPKIKPSYVFVRGNRGRRGEPAPRRYLTALRQVDEPEFRVGTGRLELAQRIGDPTNPLTSRVMVNRVWGHLIGRPLVNSASDFGYRTPPPRVPGLLDDLANGFVSDWSVKRLVRRIVHTQTYQRTTASNRKTTEADPDNQLWLRGERRRRDFESMRDSMLLCADQLDRVVGGPSIEITGSTLSPRRTLYAYIDRQNLPGLFRTFDFASPDMHSPGRSYTTVPQQSLFLMNSPQMSQLAVNVRAAAERDCRDASQPLEFVDALFRRVLGRSPSAWERSESAAYLRLPSEEPLLATDPRALWQYGTGRWEAGDLLDFKPMKHFVAGRWKYQVPPPGESDSGNTYASLAKEFAHPGLGDTVAVVRRWNPPVAGWVSVTGMIGHRNKQGDGVIAVLKIGEKVVYSGRQFSNNRPLSKLGGRVEKGQTVDFIVRSGPTMNHDSVFWRARLVLDADNGTQLEASSEDDFSGPFEAKKARVLDRRGQLAQVLLLSDEFAFVD
ncbi:MAG: PSD1 and planctomycete cytochrome C domain-containing protein [Planctomycetota bacterium]